MNKGLGIIVETSDGSLTLKHPEHGEEYHSRLGAWREAHDLYIEASGFRQVLAGAQDLAVLDVGLGLAYNALATINAWAEIKTPGNLDLTSLEIDPALIAALQHEAPWAASWPELWKTWLRSLKPSPFGVEAEILHPSHTVSCTWKIYIGDARYAEIPPGVRFDYIWQDPFSPKNNPALWNEEWFGRLRSLANVGCRLMTYSVASAVREALSAAGWQWRKIQTSGPKKQWLSASTT